MENDLPRAKIETHQIIANFIVVVMFLLWNSFVVVGIGSSSSSSVALVAPSSVGLLLFATIVNPVIDVIVAIVANAIVDSS